MAIATDEQVQRYTNERVRPSAERVRGLVLFLQDAKAAIDDTYAALTQTTPTWEDTRDDAPPHLLLPGDVLGWNAFVTDVLTAITTHGQYPVVLKACVQPVQVS